MDCAHVLKHDVSIRIEELLIISAVEAILVDADRIKFPQLEAYARRAGDRPGVQPTWKSLKVLAAICFQVPLHTPFRKLGVSISSPSLCHCE